MPPTYTRKAWAGPDREINLNKIFDCEIERHDIKELAKHINKAQLVVNATPVNMLGGSSTWEVNPECYGFDIVYRPWEGTGFLKNFKKPKRIEGIHMLVHQAAPCFKEWFGVEPETTDTELFKTLFEKMNEK